MTQADLNRAVARATGESVPKVARLGFGLLAIPESCERRYPRLLLAAKQQKRQGQLLRSTLAALKQLQNVQA